MLCLSDVTQTSIVRSLTARELPLEVEGYMVYSTLHGTFTGSVEGNFDNEDSSTYQREIPIQTGPRRCPSETHVCLYGTPCKNYSWDIGRAILHWPRTSESNFVIHYAEGHEISDIADWSSLKSGQDVWHQTIEWQVWHWHNMVKDQVHNEQRGLENIYP